MLFACARLAVQAVRAETSFCLSTPTLMPLQSVDNYFVYVISDLINTLAHPAEYLRYGETVFDAVAIKTETRIYFASRANSIYPRDLWTLLSTDNFDVVMFKRLQTPWKE